MSKYRSLATVSVVILLALSFPLKVVAISNYDKEDDKVEERMTKTGNVYKAGEKFIQDKDVVGDLIATGSEISINGEVGDNLIVAGGGVLIDGDVENDIFVAGGYIVINGNVGGDVRVAGGKIFINSEEINGDVFVYGGEVSFADGVEINGEKEVSSWKIKEGTTDNPRDLSKYDSSNFTFNADRGSFDASPIIGALTGAAFFLSIIFKLITILGGLIAGYAVLRLFPSFAEKTIVTMRNRTITSVLVGILTYLLAPFIALILLISVVGINLLVLMSLLGILAYFVSGVMSSYITGRIVLDKIGQKNPGRALTLTVGYLLIELSLLIISFVPIIGSLIVFLIRTALTGWGIGAIIFNKYISFKSKKK